MQVTDKQQIQNQVNANKNNGIYTQIYTHKKTQNSEKKKNIEEIDLSCKGKHKSKHGINQLKIKLIKT